MNKKIVLAGGTGFLGQYFTKQFRAEGYSVLIVSRSGDVTWDDQNALTAALNEAEMVINLAGKSVDCRYNPHNKKLILNSRVETTKKLGEAIMQCAIPPQTWLNASTAMYRDEYERPNTEENGIIGTGFSVEVGKQWEQAIYSFSTIPTRKITLRISIVLGKDGGVIPVYNNLVRFRLGGTQGSGKQLFSWIHIHDFYRVLCFLRDHPEIEGPVNCVSPGALTNQKFMEAMRKSHNIQFGMPATAWMIEMGALVLGTEPELILKSRWVAPLKLTSAGFAFRFPDIQSALNDLAHDVT